MAFQRNALVTAANSPGLTGSAGLRVLGYFFDKFWVRVLFFSVAPFVAFDNPLNSLISNMIVSLFGLTLSLVLIAMCYSRLAHVLCTKQAVVVAALACTVATVLLIFARVLLPTTGNAAAALNYGSAFVTGISSAVLYFAWMSIFATLKPQRALIEMSISSIASCAVGLILILFLPNVLLITLCASPLCSGALILLFMTPYRQGALLFPGQRPEQQGSDAEEKTAKSSLAAWKKRRFRMSLGSIIFGLAAGLANTLCSSGLYERTSFNGVLLVSGFVATGVIIWLFWKHFESTARVCHRFTLICMAAGCLLIALGQGNELPANMLVHVGFLCFASVLNTLAFASSFATRSGFGVARLICLVISAMYGGELAGLVIGRGLNLFFAQTVTLSNIGFALTLLIVIGYAILFTETDVTSFRQEFQTEDATAEKSVGQADADEDNVQSNEQDIVLQMSSDFGLSQREAQILPLLLKGRTLARIQEELYISQSTVNTHIRHIYQKCKVNNKQELLDLVDKYYKQ